ncbi:MAG TPA: VCBS repeat-containing protein [Candidatus Polarisedimenticolaceae bacterium]|nr:VCBS repeat-containing protein [Candidatus Polarisedimenticolaceae bacterium]
MIERRLVLLAAAAALLTGRTAGAPRELALRRVALDLPGPPAIVVPADLDGDGRRDLLVIVAYTRWGSVSTDRIEDAVAVTEVVPALFDVREARAFLAQPGGGFRAAATPLALPLEVLSAEPGPASHPVIAVTDDGLSEIRFTRQGEKETLALEPLLPEPSALAEVHSLVADLDVIRDVDDDGLLDAVIPARDGLAVHRGTAEGFAAQASFRARFPGDAIAAANGAAWRDVPVVHAEDVDGDGKRDLIVRQLGDRPLFVVARGLGEARFAPPRMVALACLQPAPPADVPAPRDQDGGPPELPRVVAWMGDLDGDGRAEIVTRESVNTGKSDTKQLKKPMMRYRLHRLRPDLTVEEEPYRSFDAEGWAFTGGFRDGIDLEFLDLDHDGRRDLVTVTLDFSMFQALRALTSKKVGIGLEFHVVAQQADGSFKLVPDQVLDEKLRLDLNRLEISRLGQFQGDFDGDGRTDFVHLGKGKTVTIHRGQPGGRYPEKPDLSIPLEEEPEDVMLVRVRDFDGDGRSDLAITRTLPPPEAGATAPARLELNLSGDGK